MQHHKKGIWALSPIFVLLITYLVTSIVANDFYKVPIVVAFLISAIYGIAITHGNRLEERIHIFSKGAGHSNMMLMIWIFILAGAFASSAKNMGAIDATVNLALRLLPDNLLLAGIFIASCFISLSVGTSVGTIVALTPIAAGIADKTGASLPMIVAIVVGGAYFGDNLSFISDTTILATKTQGCEMKDKFKVNFQIVTPAAIIALVLYFFIGSGVNSPQHIPDVNFLKVIPYLVVLITAVMGLNVLLVLTSGTVLAGFIGILNGNYDLYSWFDAMGSGIMGMGELIIITMLAGGLMELIRYNGGIDYAIKMLTRKVNSKRGAELSIAALVSLTDLCTANNTVAIITVGPLANDIAQRYGVDKRKSASILDTFSCFAQGLIPYGAQMLMASGLAGINPLNIIPYLYYPMLMGGFALMSILFRYPKKYS